MALSIIFTTQEMTNYRSFLVAYSPSISKHNYLMYKSKQK